MPWSAREAGTPQAHESAAVLRIERGFGRSRGGDPPLSTITRRARPARVPASRYRKYRSAADQNGGCPRRHRPPSARGWRGGRVGSHRRARCSWQRRRPSDQANTGGKDRGRQPSSGVPGTGEGLGGVGRLPRVGAQARSWGAAAQREPQVPARGPGAVTCRSGHWATGSPRPSQPAASTALARRQRPRSTRTPIRASSTSSVQLSAVNRWI